MAAGSGLENIGRLMAASRESEEERRRREAEENRLAFERARADAERAEATGVTFQPASAPPVTFNAPQFGESGRMSSLAPPRPARDLTEIGRLRGLEDQFQPGGFVKTGPSAADRTQIAAAQLASRTGEAMASVVPGAAELTPSQRTLMGAGELPPAMVAGAASRRASAEADALEAAGHLAAPYWGNRPRNLGVEATNAIGRQLAARSGSGAGGETPSSQGAASRTPSQARADLAVIRPQINEAQQDLAAATRGQPWQRAETVEAAEAGATAAGRRFTDADRARTNAAFTADSIAGRAAMGRLQARSDSLTARADTLAARAQGQQLPAPGTVVPAPRTPPPVVPAARPARPSAGGGFTLTPSAPRRVVTQDQADYLRATGQWDPTRYEVR